MSVRRKWTFMFVALAVAAAPALVSAATLPATADIWVRESAPDTNYEVDTISVWSSSATSNGVSDRRYALVEFDVSSLAGQPLKSAYISLFSFNRAGWTQTNKPIKQTAYSVASAGTPIESLTWNLYLPRDAGKVAFESLGKYENGPISTDPAQQDVYIDTMAASAADLAAISAEANGDGKLTLVLIAAEDNDYRRDWGDIQWAGKPALLNVEVVPEPMTLALLALGSLGAFTRSRRKPVN